MNLMNCKSHYYLPAGERGLFWDEESRLTAVVDVAKTASYYTYDAAGERTLKLTGNFEEMNINGQYSVDLYNINNFSLASSPYVVFNKHGYTKHYYVEADRIASKIGGGMSHSGNDFGEHIYVFNISTQNDYGRKSEENAKTMYNHLDSAQSNVGSQFEVLVDVDFRKLQEFLAVDEPEKEIFFFHKDHLGSSTQISDMSRRVIHHIEYMPTGELFAEQRDHWATPYKFNGKELDEETGLYYYGARYYTPEVGIWLSVDPLSDKYPSMSAFMYCAGNPVVLVDPDGRELHDFGVNEDGKIVLLKFDNKSPNRLFKVDKNGNKIDVNNDGKEVRGQDYINISNEVANSFNYQSTLDICDNFSERSFAKTSNDKEASQIFEFLSLTDKVEFSLINMTKDGESLNILTTSHVEEYVDNNDILDSYISQGWTLNRKSHNHPGGGEPSIIDRENATHYRKQFPNAIFDIFTKKGGYEYKY